METRANYILIGLFTLAGFLGLLAFFIWLARVELDRQFAYYDVRFNAVSGLSRASDVRFSGLPVGQVVDLRLAPERDGTVLVRLEIDAATPIREDSVATIEAQGVTGVSYVAISAGSPDRPLLVEADGAAFPEITSGRSVLQSLTEDAPEILSELLSVLDQIGTLLGPENQQRVDNILANLETSSENFASALDDFAAVSDSVAVAAGAIAEFADRLDEITTAGVATMQMADTALLNLSQLSNRAQQTLQQGDAALQSATRSFDSAGRFLDDDLPALVTDLTEASAALRADLDALTVDARGLIDQFSATGAAATARLNEAQATIAATDAMIARLTETLDTVDRAAGSFDTMLTGDGAALVAEARSAVSGANEAIATISRVAETDLPAIMTDIRGATETASRVIEQVGGDLSAASGRIDGIADDAQGAIAAATDTFSRANQTLTAINEALSAGERTLAAAERAFEGADRLIDEDISALVAQLRESMTRLDGAIAQVSDDIPAVTADLRAAAESARVAFLDMGEVVGTAGEAVTGFATTGLPQYTRLAQETRNLIASLERVTRQIERDPTRFFLDRQTPEFRR
ncbi:MlaD family protein [Alkalilacustris brevis]|uniref:MlaD family protein n=1 Tax=Alkalilacustris brevis TaxID=2026338 RepID=UPI000E0DF5B2|nr:MlaD family protein [Alkalilacustris brevis]